MQLKRYGPILLRWLWLLLIFLAAAAAASWFIVNLTHAPYGPLLIVIPVMIFGLVWGLGAVFALEQILDNRRTNYSAPELQHIAALPVLGVIDHGTPLQAGSGGHPAFTVFDGPRTRAGEAYMNVARALLPPGRRHERAYVIMVVAGQPSGHTSTAGANVAAASALLGFPTLLIDAERPTSEMIQAHSLNGAVWLPQTSDDESFAGYSVPPSPNLFVLAARGESVIDTVTLIESQLQEVISRPGARGSVIVIAGPPVGEETGWVGLRLTSDTDEAVVVAVDGETRHGMLRRTLGGLRRTRTHVAGVLLVQGTSFSRARTAGAPAEPWGGYVPAEAATEAEAGMPPVRPYEPEDVDVSPGWRGGGADDGWTAAPTEASAAWGQTYVGDAYSVDLLPDDIYRPGEEEEVNEVVEGQTVYEVYDPPDAASAVPVDFVGRHRDRVSESASDNVVRPYMGPEEEAVSGSRPGFKAEDVDLSGLGDLGGKIPADESLVPQDLDFSGLDTLGGELASEQPERRKEPIEGGRAAGATSMLPLTPVPPPTPAEPGAVPPVRVSAVDPNPAPARQDGGLHAAPATQTDPSVDIIAAGNATRQPWTDGPESARPATAPNIIYAPPAAPRESQQPPAPAASPPDVAPAPARRPAEPPQREVAAAALTREMPVVSTPVSRPAPVEPARQPEQQAEPPLSTRILREEPPVEQPRATTPAQPPQTWQPLQPERVERVEPITAPQPAATAQPEPELAAPAVPYIGVEAEEGAAAAGAAREPVGILKAGASLLAAASAARRMPARRRQARTRAADVPGLGTRLQLVGAGLLRTVTGRNSEARRQPPPPVATAPFVAPAAPQAADMPAPTANDDVSVWLAAAERARVRGARKEAKELIDRVLDRDPRNQQAWALRLMLLEGEPVPDQARTRVRGPRISPGVMAVAIVVVLLAVLAYFAWPIASGALRNVQSQLAATPVPTVSGTQAPAVSSRPPTPTALGAGSASHIFPETGFEVKEPFLGFWNSRGGLLVFGYPISKEIQENGITVQYFERARMEMHPRSNGNGSDIQLGRLGAEVPASGTVLNPLPQGLSGDLVGYAQGDIKSPPKFYSFWQQHGGAPIFGYPLTPVLSDTGPDGKPLVVQYFERARMEYHPENAGTPNEVLLSSLGTQVYRAKYGQ